VVEIIVRNDGKVLLLTVYPCNHFDEKGKPSRHVHYYITDRVTPQLLDWLEAGGWWDSGIESPRPIVRRFLERRCMGNTHFLGGAC